MHKVLWITIYWALLFANAGWAQTLLSSANQFSGPAAGSLLSPRSSAAEVVQASGATTKALGSSAANLRSDGLVDGLPDAPPPNSPYRNQYSLPPSQVINYSTVAPGYSSSGYAKAPPIVAGTWVDTTTNALPPVADPPSGAPLHDPIDPTGPVVVTQPGMPATPCVGWESHCPDFLPQGSWLANTWSELHEWSHTSPLLSPNIWRNFSEFSGVQAFKGPVDLGINGDFGFYKGVNFAWPLLEAWGIGYQLGGEIVVSNLSGSGGPFGITREQYFATTGLFRRAANNRGLQGGAVVDYLHDNFYVHMNLLQIRPEISYVICGGNEIGVWAALNLKSETKSAPAIVGTPTVTWLTTDQYNFFYRHWFKSGGVGRTWVGFTDYGDVTFGADATAPLAESWAIQASYNYLLPMGTDPVSSNTRETWGLSMSLVWYPHCKTPNASFNPFKPLLNVADNSSLFIRTK